MTNKELRRRALEILAKGGWLRCIGAAVLAIVPVIFISFPVCDWIGQLVSAIFADVLKIPTSTVIFSLTRLSTVISAAASAAAALLCAPFTVGLCAYFYNVCRGMKLSPLAVYDPLKKFWGCVLLEIFVSVYSLAIYGIPAAAAMILYRVSKGSGILFYAAQIFALIALVLIAFAAVKYIFCYFVYGENFGYITPRAAFLRGAELSRRDGMTISNVKLALSFVPWSLLCVLTCGIGLVFLIPWEMMTFAVKYNET